MSAQSRGMLLRGAMREFKVSADRDNNRAGLGSTSAEEIASLRNRVNMNRGTDDEDGRRSLVPTTKSTRSGFAGVLGGVTPAENPVEPTLPLRQGYEPEYAPANGAAGYDPAAYPPPPVPPWPGAGGYDEAGQYQPYGADAAGYDPAYGAAYPPGYAPGEGYPPALMSPEAAYAANSAFGQLADSLMNRAMGGRSIEDTTRELLRTMLKQWLDDNLPQLVERLVREEIERVARRDR